MPRVFLFDRIGEPHRYDEVIGCNGTTCIDCQRGSDGGCRWAGAMIATLESWNGCPDLQADEGDIAALRKELSGTGFMVEEVA